MERTADAICRFVSLAEKEGADAVYAFATAAVRSASNGQAFLQTVEKRCGVKAELISGSQEAEIGLCGALGNGDGGILDVGGASSELAFRQSGRLSYAKSVDIGAVRLFDLCGREREKLLSVIGEKVAAYGDIALPVPLYAIGGTATSLAAFLLRLTRYDAEKVNGTVIALADMAALANELLRLDAGEIVERSCLPYKRAEIVAGGALLIQKVMEKIGAERVIVSESDNLEGYARLKGLS